MVCGERLFASVNKFESRSGGPSFTRPIEGATIVVPVDESHGDSHLGHLFPDGPAAQGGMCYCINSASLRFIHLKDFEAQGYGRS